MVVIVLWVRLEDECYFKWIFVLFRRRMVFYNVVMFIIFIDVVFRIDGVILSLDIFKFYKV